MDSLPEWSKGADQVPLAEAAWVQIPQLSFFLGCLVPSCVPMHPKHATVQKYLFAAIPIARARMAPQLTFLRVGAVGPNAPFKIACPLGVC